jgi:hypothetical protein
VRHVPRFGNDFNIDVLNLFREQLGVLNGDKITLGASDNKRWYIYQKTGNRQKFSYD